MLILPFLTLEARVRSMLHSEMILQDTEIEVEERFDEGCQKVSLYCIFMAEKWTWLLGGLRAMKNVYLYLLQLFHSKCTHMCEGGI